MHSSEEASVPSEVVQTLVVKRAVAEVAADILDAASRFEANMAHVPESWHVACAQEDETVFVRLEATDSVLGCAVEVHSHGDGSTLWSIVARYDEGQLPRRVEQFLASILPATMSTTDGAEVVVDRSPLALSMCAPFPASAQVTQVEPTTILGFHPANPCSEPHIINWGVIVCAIDRSGNSMIRPGMGAVTCRIPGRPPWREGSVPGALNSPNAPRETLRALFDPMPQRLQGEHQRVLAEYRARIVAKLARLLEPNALKRKYAVAAALLRGSTQELRQERDLLRRRNEELDAAQETLASEKTSLERIVDDLSKSAPNTSETIRDAISGLASQLATVSRRLQYTERSARRDSSVAVASDELACARFLLPYLDFADCGFASAKSRTDDAVREVFEALLELNGITSFPQGRVGTGRDFEPLDHVGNLTIYERRVRRARIYFVRSTGKSKWHVLLVNLMKSAAGEGRQDADYQKLLRSLR